MGMEVEVIEIVKITMAAEDAAAIRDFIEASIKAAQIDDHEIIGQGPAHLFMSILGKQGI